MIRKYSAEDWFICANCGFYFGQTDGCSLFVFHVHPNNIDTLLTPILNQGEQAVLYWFIFLYWFVAGGGHFTAENRFKYWQIITRLAFSVESLFYIPDKILIIYIGLCMLSAKLDYLILNINLSEDG